MDVRVGLWRKLSTEELMLLNCGVGEDLGVPWTARRYIHWKDSCWSWSSKTLATWCEELTHWKRLWCWESLKAKGEGGEDEMVGWHHQLNGHEREQTAGDSEGQRSLQSTGLQRVGHDLGLKNNNTWVSSMSSSFMPFFLWMLRCNMLTEACSEADMVY